ncbi:hypothetical protein V6N13_133070 [Hibiscus sabdariffa]
MSIIVDHGSLDYVCNYDKHEATVTIRYTCLIGLFMASQPSIIACGIPMTIVGTVLKFMAGPALMAASSAAFGLRGKSLRMAIAHAGSSSSWSGSIFAKEYNIYPDTLSTGVFFGMLIAVPTALIYYLVLAL